ncbi:class III poly(R)-hydroxyalkanoic acid synthase subunit PhaC [Motiliproteus coralliicola]|uniref:Poly(3-hydroxyalkanoate) polymerase subunit PhaC n=1 Tax=Motiliproteus coralliicola TaxID=2283196 RepID=A0A369WSC7_9GAMM|nr:class III poly(R)-hydroxyalkanoic acid synthase subunit PhaC [Motiliproteus coralliicola]RDE24461.1 class III poly(R)-hydroxyalkanoic acid synthase subunit PhaC [Motiliproteus coralliicola]
MSRIKLNPEQLLDELQQRASNLVEGMQTLQHLDAVAVGQTEHQCIYTEDRLRLLHYPALDKSGNPVQSKRRPLLIVYALVNRPYILDLQPDRSLIRALTSRGQPVYLIDWGYPVSTDAYLDLDDYINGYIDNCVEQVNLHAGVDRPNLLGVCQGGAFSLCYSAINPEQVHSLTTLVTPVDFHTDDNLLGYLANRVDLRLARQANGNIDGGMLTQIYKALMPMRLGLLKELSMPAQLANPEAAKNFLRMERWINDSPDLAGTACCEFVDKFYHHNRFVNGDLLIGDEVVELKNYQGPLLNIFAARDHLVPPAASRALASLTGSQQYQEHELSGGHIGVFVGRHAQQQLPDLLSTWMKQQG